MTRYPVYLEVAGDGLCMAHVLDLPGCVVRAPSRDEALRQLPDAIRQYHAWLRHHGEPAPPDDAPSEIEVAGESSGCGPFAPGDAAALFSPDQEPLTPKEMEDYIRLMGHARADLLALARDLSDDVLDWQPDPESLSVRRLLRHVGNAEQWYVSRLVAPETLPPEWQHDEELPIYEFLEMERRTALARLRQLTAQERAGVFHPTRWTEHPEEPWTARKALRRFLEHEREHTGQVREILAAWRVHLLARLATERTGLLEPLVGLDEETLAASPVFDTWTARDLLAHVAGWDELFTERIERIMAGREGEITRVDLEARNAALYAERQDWSLTQALEACVTARADFLATLARLSDQELHRLRTFSWGETSARQWTGWRARHDAAHAAQIGTWARGLRGNAGPKHVLVAALNAAREELLAAAALVPPGARTSRPVCGAWTLKDVLGHVTDWEWLGAEGLRQMAAGQAPQVEYVEDIEAWNQAHVEARQGQPWEVVWADLNAARQVLLEILEGMSQADLGRSFPFPWGSKDTAYRWVCVFLAHDREHAQDLRNVAARL